MSGAAFLLVVDVEADGGEQNEALDDLLHVASDPDEGHTVVQHTEDETADDGTEYRSDTAAGRRNLGVILGRDRALSAVADSLAAPPLLVAVTLPFLHYNRGELALTMFVYAACAAGAAFAYTRPGRDAIVWAFRFVALGSVLFSAGWLAAV